MARSKPCTPASPVALTPDRLIAEIARVAFADVRRLFNKDGSLKPVCELDDDTAAKRTAKLKIDRIAALTLLGKFLLDGRAAATDQSGPVEGLAEAIARIRRQTMERECADDQ